ARRAQSIGRSPLPALGPVVRSVLRLPTSFAAVGLACFESHLFGPLLIVCAVDLDLARQPMNGLCQRCVAAVDTSSYDARGPGGAAGPGSLRAPEQDSRPQRSTTVLLPERNTRPSQRHFTAFDRALHSASRPAATRSSGVKAWSTSTSCWAMIGPSSSSL